jgi:hypothetical protein
MIPTPSIEELDDLIEHMESLLPSSPVLDLLEEASGESVVIGRLIVGAQ